MFFWNSLAFSMIQQTIDLTNKYKLKQLFIITLPSIRMTTDMVITLTAGKMWKNLIACALVVGMQTAAENLKNCLAIS